MSTPTQAIIKQPECLYRKDDGERFVLNPDGKTYSNELLKQMGGYGFRYGYEQLMATGAFQITPPNTK